VQRGDSGDPEAYNDNEDLSFTQSGKHDENQDDGEVIIPERSVLRDTPRKRKRDGVIAKYNETIIEIEKQRVKFLEEAIKNSQPENEDMLFFRSLLPHVNNIPAYMKLRFRNRIQQVVDEFAYPLTSTFKPYQFSLSSPLPSTSSTNSLPSEGVPLPPAVFQDTNQNNRV
jgi:hypothetical protein